ncbi:uncharacterized protein EV420DRAFT_1753022 [Desarmillaria tabescens]|uniref:Uncharacterized protein n=1 Tax=Armillaria tabescens TaxID=1929756 RepID=A0AA39MMD6_ARMTA|nr:uncharacterized protein EV420DRAFT_1753022 [Desarmillaria tabescens]KAK0439248.1 hypothetical protein EV420DRAFT_1753022 [Desarmillaria tabescens]
MPHRVQRADEKALSLPRIQKSMTTQQPTSNLPFKISIGRRLLPEPFVTVPQLNEYLELLRCFAELKDEVENMAEAEQTNRGRRRDNECDNQGSPQFNFLPMLSVLEVTISKRLDEELGFVDDTSVAMTKVRRDALSERTQLSKVVVKAITPGAKFKRLSDEGIRVLKDCKAGGLEIEIKAIAASGEGDNINYV